MFEAFQERPQYWDGIPYHRSVTLSRGTGNKDWIQSWQRVAREHDSIDAAIAYAKRILAQRPGCPVEIRYTRAGGARVAIVSRDALGRVWVDSFNNAGLI